MDIGLFHLHLTINPVIAEEDAVLLFYIELQDWADQIGVKYSWSRWRESVVTTSNCLLSIHSLV